MASTQATLVAKVFGVTELLEKILLGLPNQKLLIAQRTCTTWRDTIKCSDRIQKALCIQAMGLFDDTHHKTLEAAIMSNNFDRLEPIKAESAQEYLDQVVVNEYHVNPLLQLFLEVTSDVRPQDYSYATRQYKYKHALAARVLSWPSCASQMFLTQPPTITVQFECCQNLKHWDHPLILSNPNGITLNDVVAKIEERRRASDGVDADGTTYVLDFIVPVEPDPALRKHAMRQMTQDYLRMRQEEGL